MIYDKGFHELTLKDSLTLNGNFSNNNLPPTDSDLFPCPERTEMKPESAGCIFFKSGATKRNTSKTSLKSKRDSSR
jgi:hypothetical protein